MSSSIQCSNEARQAVALEPKSTAGGLDPSGRSAHPRSTKEFHDAL